MRVARRVVGILPALAVAACSTVGPSPPAPTPEPYAALHVVRTGPYPLYETYGAWVATPPSALPAAHSVWLHSGCIFDVRSTTPDAQEAGASWAYGRVVQCAEVVYNQPLEPQMGIRPREWRIFDGRLGYFPMRLLDPYTGVRPRGAEGDVK